MERAIHTFDNGVRVYEDQLLDEQRARYERRNVHEAEEEEIFLDLIRRLPPDGCFVDVGAAIGYYLILAHKLSPRLTIHGVEPLERHRRFLNENLVLNGLTRDDFVIHSEGLTSSAGSENFMDRGYSSRLASGTGQARLSLSARWKHLLGSSRPAQAKECNSHYPDDHPRRFCQAGGPADRSPADGRAGLGSGSPEGRDGEPENGCREILPDRHAWPGARAHSA